MGSDAEPEAMARRVNCSNRHMTVGGLAAEYGFTDFDSSQLEAWRYLGKAETGMFADVADQR
jgi:hypothetical protein